jgi:tetratricopeptide (TPR) repeat protein
MTQFIKLALSLGFMLPFYGQIPFSVIPSAHANQTCHSCVRIGIIPLKYEGDQKKIGFYAQGTQDSLIHALSSVKSFIVVDRTRTHEVLKEIAFQQSAYVDQKTQVEIGKILGVEYLYTGSMQEIGGRLRIIIERIHIATGQVNAIAQVTGQTEDLFELQDQIAQKIIGQAQVAVTPLEKQEVSKQLQVTSSLTAYEYFNRGLEAYQNNDYNKALADYTKAIEIDPKYATTYTARGATYGALKQYSKEIADYTKAIELDPTYAPAYYNRGIAYDDIKQYDRAIADYTRALEINPQYTSAYNNRGNAYFDLKQYDKAIADYTRIIEIDPTYDSAYSNRGNTYKALKQYNRAIADYTRAIAINPQNASVYNNRGDVYADIKQPDKAIADYTRAIAINPQYASAYNNRGVAYFYDLKQYDRAIADYTRAIEIDPKYALAYDNRGNVYFDLKQKDKAIADFKKACQLGLDSTCAWLKKNGY